MPTASRNSRRNPEESKTDSWEEVSVFVVVDFSRPGPGESGAEGLTPAAAAVSGLAGGVVGLVGRLSDESAIGSSGRNPTGLTGSGLAFVVGLWRGLRCTGGMLFPHDELARPRGLRARRGIGLIRWLGWDAIAGHPLGLHG